MNIIPSQFTLSSFKPPNLNPIAKVASGNKKEINPLAVAIRYIIQAFPNSWPLPIPYFSAAILSALVIAVSMWVSYDYKRDIYYNYEANPRERRCHDGVFDYIIVGGGTAGMIVATRIANASRKMRVLLLEQGGEPSILHDIPGLHYHMLQHPNTTFTYKSVSQENACQSCYNRTSSTTKGKMLGGSSSMNLMMYVRGHMEDYNRWAQDINDDKWNYSNLLPYFKKSEDYNGAYANDPDASHYHGRFGLLNVGTYNFMPGIEDFLAAGAETGYPVADCNGKEQEVFSKVDLTVQDGWRENTYRAFYKDTGHPPNLCIKKFAQVTKILFDSVTINKKPKVVAVTYERHNLTTIIAVSKEVILSAGVFHSAKLLMLSGIGVSKELKNLGIQSVKNLPVGKNLQDHVGVLVGPFLKSPSFNPTSDITTRTGSEFVSHGEGILAAPAGLAGTAFLRSPVAEPAYPDLQITQFSLALHPELPGSLSDVFGIKRHYLHDWFDPFQYKNPDARFIFLSLGRPKSTGTVTLASDDPNEDLILDPNYLSHPQDKEALFWGVKKVVELFENTTALNTPLLPKSVPACEREHFKSDHYYRCLVKHMSVSFYDHTSTCAMGTVVDNKLRVKGVKGLRVVDASVMPRITNGNTQAATIMIGEKGADLIINDMNE